MSSSRSVGAPGGSAGGGGSGSGRGYASDPNGRGLDAGETPRRSTSGTPSGARGRAQPSPFDNPFRARPRRPVQSQSFTRGSSQGRSFAQGAPRGASDDALQGTVATVLMPVLTGAPVAPIASAMAQDRASSGPRRRATHDSAASSLSLDTLRSDCRVRRNSIRFTRDDPDDFDANSEGSDGSGYLTGGAGDLEVMDLRPSNHAAVQRMETSSLVSLGSNLSIDSELASGLFRVASGTSAASVNRGMQEIGDALRGDLPGHWERAGAGHAAAAHSADGAAGVGIENPLGESEMAYRALMRLMRDGGTDEDVGGDVRRADNNIVGLNNSLTLPSSHGSSGNDGTGMRRRESFCSVETGRSGFWSAIGPFHGGNSLAPDAESTSGSESSGKRSEGGSSADVRRKRRKAYVRRCARAMAVIVALAALSLGTVALVADDGLASLAEMLPDNVWGFFRGGYDETKRYRKLPEGVHEEEGQDGIVIHDLSDTGGGVRYLAGKTPRQMQRIQERLDERKAKRIAAILAARRQQNLQRKRQRRNMMVEGEDGRDPPQEGDFPQERQLVQNQAWQDEDARGFAPGFREERIVGPWVDRAGPGAVFPRGPQV